MPNLPEDPLDALKAEAYAEGFEAALKRVPAAAHQFRVMGAGVEVISLRDLERALKTIDP